MRSATGLQHHFSLCVERNCASSQVLKIWNVVRCCQSQSESESSLSSSSSSSESLASANHLRNHTATISNQQKMKKLQMWCKINDSPAKAVSVELQKGRCQFLRFLDKAISSASFLDMLQIPATGTTHLYSDIPYVSLSISCCAIGSFSSWWYSHNMSQYSRS